MTDLKISQLQEKTSLVGNDVITILDSEDSNHNKKAKSDVINTYVFGQTSTNVQGLTQKNSLADNDVLTILDSADSLALKKVLASSISTKQRLVTDTTSTTTSVSVAENTRYVYTQPLTSLTLSSVADSLLESEIDFTTGTSFSFTATPLTNKWIDFAQTWLPNTHYIIVIKSGYASWGIIGY